MTYGMLASGSCFLTDIVDRFHEAFKKVNSLERLTLHLNIEVPLKALKAYRTTVRKRILPNQSFTNKNVYQKAENTCRLHFCYYRLAKGISGLLSYAKEEHTLASDNTSKGFIPFIPSTSP